MDELDQQPQWDDLPPVEKLAWQAAMRHLVNLLEVDDVAGLKQHEQHWGTWVQTKLGVS